VTDTLIRTPGQLRRSTDRSELVARTDGTITITSLETADKPKRDGGNIAPQPFGRRVAAASREAVRQLTGADFGIAVQPPAGAVIQRRGEPSQRFATISCVIPCYNEQDTIAEVLTSLLAQTRLPDVIHVVVNNTDDDTLEIAQTFAGSHTRTVKGVKYHTVVHLHDMGTNPDKKVGALNYGYKLSVGYDFFLGVDGDTTLDRSAVEWLEKEMVGDPRIGGLSAIYSIDKEKVKGGLARFLVAGQRAQFAAFNLDNLLRGRNMAVLGGQCSLFSIRALEMVMQQYHQSAPWVRDSEVEDSKLSLQIKDSGFSTKISARARANVGPMTDLRGLHGQQVKWNFGAIDLFWPGQRGDTKGQPMHPNRMGFALLLAAALSIHAFVFNPVWLIPPAIALLLNLRLALAMKDKSASDLLYAGLFLPAEAYMWIRMGHFMTAWAQFFARVEKDNWAAQAAAERGRGSAYIFPAVVAVAVFGALIYAWTQQPINVQSDILRIGWPLLYIATIAQTFFMFRKVIRRYRGFAV
jgi:biofilm PGA synthesis N-glycosyltransferase PgaC